MEKLTLVSLFVTIFFMQWHNIAAESNNTVEAKVTSAMNKNGDEYIAVVKDDKAKSGWAIDVKKKISEELSEIYYVIFYSRTDPKANFKYSFFGSLWNLLVLKDKKVKFLPAQITGMIFPTQKGDLKVNKTPILDTAQVNGLASVYEYTDRNQVDRAELPEKTPFEMEVRIMTYKQIEDIKGEYVFKVNFNIGGDINKK